MEYFTNGVFRHLGDGIIDTYAHPEYDAQLSVLRIEVDGVEVLEGSDPDNYTDNGNGTVTFNSVPANGAAIEIRRVTESDDRLVTHTDAAILLAAFHNKDSDQLMYLIQELLSELWTGTIRLSSAYGNNWDAGGLEIRNLADGTEDDSAINKSQLDGAYTTLLGLITSLEGVVTAGLANLQNQITALANMVANLAQLVQQAVVGASTKPGFEAFLVTTPGGQNKFYLSRVPLIEDWKINIQVIIEGIPQPHTVVWSYNEVDNSIDTVELIPYNVLDPYAVLVNYGYL